MKNNLMAMKTYDLTYERAVYYHLISSNARERREGFDYWYCSPEI